MTDQRDEIDDWLSRDVTPLSPPPGALDRIRRRARQRKVRQAVIASAGCAVVLAGAVAAPKLIAGLQPAGGHPPAAAGRASVTPPSAHPGSSGTRGTAGPDTSGITQLLERTQLSTTTSGTVPPPHFRPTSVTFVGTGSGGVVGAVIGQAGPPCATNYCTSLAGTSDYGRTWYGVSAPVAPGPDASTGVSQLRFANLRDGWAFGPALYETSGGGWPWQQEDTHGQRVLALEASGQGALAIFATCAGTGADYAAGCTSFTLYGSAVGSTTWAPVAVPAAFAHLNSAVAPLLVISGSTGYLVTPSGAVLSGPVAGGSWAATGQTPCPAVAALQLAASQRQLLLTCGGQPGGPVLYTSATGATWQQAGLLPQSGTPTSLASVASGQVVLATTAGIFVSSDGGSTWQSARVGGPLPRGGFSYVGMTNAAQGVAVPADSAVGGIYVTRDGGQTWNPSPIAG